MLSVTPWGGGLGSRDFTGTVEKSFLLAKRGVWRDGRARTCVVEHKYRVWMG